jgi:diguanylate cyclase (GGDEF)-like protein/PAS domain S-box-containing protein
MAVGRPDVRNPCKRKHGRRNGRNGWTGRRQPQPTGRRPRGTEAPRGRARAARGRVAGHVRRERGLHQAIDLDGHLVRINRAGSLALCVPEQPSPPPPWLSLLPEELREDGEAALAIARTGVPARFPGFSLGEDGRMRHWDNLLNPILGADGRTDSILCISRDVTSLHEAIQQRHESEERLAIAARVGGLGVWDYDIRNDRLYCDESWYRIMGRNRNSPIRSLAEFKPFIHPDDVEKATEVPRTAAELIASNQDYSIEFRIVRPDGEVRWIRSLAYLQQEGGIPSRAVGFVSDITDAMHGERELRDANRALESERLSLARKILEDPLTGIANRRQLDDELARMCAQANESGEPLCIGMVDVDRFKQFNDRHGHLDGDTALRRIASALQSVARQSDCIARYGGDEFTFLLPGTGDPKPFLERFVAAVAALAIPHADSPTGRLTVSCGAVAPVGGAPLSPQRLLQLGDEALYEAKQAGRDRFVVRVVEA